MKKSVDSFKTRLNRGDLIVGTWLKTPAYIVADVLAGTELDVLCIDAEHAPFDRLSIDSSVLACKAHAMPVLVRVPTAAPHELLNALDVGATGVIVPHVTSGSMAEAITKAAQYGPDGRGYAGSSRAAGYTRRSMPQHVADSLAETVVVAQIEDRRGVENIQAIASVADIDCMFIGRADLALSYQTIDAQAPSVIAAAERICTVAREAGKRVGMFLADLSEVPRWHAVGVTVFLLESDHTFLIRGAASLAARIRSIVR